jgi:phosphinothricin acetyltransferase
MENCRNVSFEPLGESHRETVIDLLNFYISSTTAAFRDKAVNYSHFDNFLDKDGVLRGYAIKCESGAVIGFCTLEPFKNIPPFRTTAEVMYFILKGYVGKGIGAIILEKLEDDARRLGIRKLIVDVTDDNEASLKFHRKHGFSEYGRLRSCWKKFDKDLGIVFMEKNIEMTELDEAER